MTCERRIGGPIWSGRDGRLGMKGKVTKLPNPGEVVFFQERVLVVGKRGLEPAEGRTVQQVRILFEAIKKSF